MKSLVCRWLCLLSLSLPLLIWFGHRGWSVRPGGPWPAAGSTGRRGYVRITRSRGAQVLDMNCSRCALVSSSGQMLGAGVGEEVDQAKCVIRMNNAPTGGFEEDVGSRTTIRVTSHTSVPMLVANERYYFQQSANTTYVFWGPERNMRRDGKGRVFNTLLEIARKYPHVRMYTVSREKIQHCDDVFENETGKNRMKTGAFLSTGFFTMILAIDLCDSIRVYGMIDDQYCSRANRSAVPYHYYERNRIDECRMYRVHERKRRGGHRFITEKAIYAKWARQHKMEFRHPTWKL
ncbi:alpha-N-acetyl-neuraminyl-2,3-beta-galactosyl-1,3-N-acetyl-galactosaminide alpha-2,6-sialyltransferase [Brachionichthys hirsutus]|uniref:alpha-N-acetyl-neuraminyl-2,3-beta-galactosyl-1, 3-N-acetyl-galactosaminide alpha-2,6-sialyltransferase n=1 Tax=Brachionichthys hirsutus TaxID=412623 RepID=UPI00360440E3